MIDDSYLSIKKCDLLVVEMRWIGFVLFNFKWKLLKNCSKSKKKRERNDTKECGVSDGKFLKKFACSDKDLLDSDLLSNYHKFIKVGFADWTVQITLSKGYLHAVYCSSECFSFVLIPCSFRTYKCQKCSNVESGVTSNAWTK